VNAETGVFAIGSFSSNPMSKLTRRMRSGCAPVTTGHAAALPSPAMNVRRSFDHLVDGIRIELGTSKPNAFASESFSSFVISTPTRLDRSLCCTRAVNGHTHCKRFANN
jgi:hypothetical protein